LTITLTFNTKTNATKYYSNQTKCSKVNDNDLLGNIFFYLPANIEFKFFEVELTKPDFTYLELGQATYEESTNRIVYNWKEDGELDDICLGSIS